jgi:hypothetical protein
MPVATTLLLLTLAGCQNEPEEQRPAACSGTDKNAVALITSLRFGREHEDGTAPGFDLDDDVSSLGGTTGCGRPDHVDPEGVEGIDNAFARIVPLLDQTEAVAVEGIVLDHIQSGELLLIIELQDLDDPLDDACVDVTLGRAKGEVLQSADAELMPHQTFERDLDLPSSLVLEAALQGGRVDAAPVQFSMPINIFGAELNLQLNDGALRVELAEDGFMSGFVAGGVDIGSILDIVYNNAVGDEVKDLLEGMLRASADLDPDGDGTCDHISTTLEFDATPAFLYE